MAQTGRKLLIGLVGAGIQQSLSPAMHEEEARHQGLRLHYQLIDLDRNCASAADLPMLLSAARLMDFAGLNITFPCKQAVVPLLDELSESAAEMGAVNTVVIRGGRLIGENTDGWGWAWGFRRALPHADLACPVLVGAGGAGSAIAWSVVRMGASRLRIVDQDPQRAQTLAAALRQKAEVPVETFADVADALEGATGLIHATPTGMAKMPGSAVPAALLRPPLWVAEVVYFPLETELIRTAREQGCTTLDGGAMAVGQAIRAFALFTGQEADPARMESHFRGLCRAADGAGSRGS